MIIKDEEYLIYAFGNLNKLYYFAFLQHEKFIKLTLNVEKVERGYKVTSIDGEPPDLLFFKNYWDNVLIPRKDINILFGNEMYCLEDDPMMFMRELFAQFKEYERSAEKSLSDIRHDLKIIADEALKL